LRKRRIIQQIEGIINIAKRVVEIAIETNEETARDFIDTELQKLSMVI
jgi:hypothetical protein